MHICYRFKYYEEMEPIECMEDASGEEYCNLAIKTSEDYGGNSGKSPGVRLFPIMQHYFNWCSTCDDSDDDDSSFYYYYASDDDECNNIDIEYFYYFNASFPTDFQKFNYNKTTKDYLYTGVNYGPDGLFYLVSNQIKSYVNNHTFPTHTFSCVCVCVFFTCYSVLLMYSSFYMISFSCEFKI